MNALVRSSISGLAAAAATAALSLMPSLAGAAGLGELRVTSALGQPLRAEIDIVSMHSGEGEFAARVARLADAELDPIVHTVQMKMVRRGARSVLQLSTHYPVNSPYLQLPVELSSSKTRITRSYTVLLDPPSVARESLGGVLVTAAPLR